MTIAPTDLRILVISLENAASRRRLMSAQLESPNMPPYSWIDAVDGRALDPARRSTIYDETAAARHNRPLTPPEIGCAASHLAAYRRMVDENLPVALVLEDDALLGHQSLQAIARVLSHVDPELPEAILLSHVGRYSAWRGRRLDKLHRLYRPYSAYGAHAYLITLAGARAMLAALQPIRTVADDWRHFMRTGILDVRAVVPYPVGTTPGAGISQIGSERFAGEQRRGLARWLRKYLWQKFLFQLVVKPALRLKAQPSTW